MRRTLLISALTAIVVMAIAVFAAPRLGTAIAGPDSQEEMAIDDVDIATILIQAKRFAAFAAANPWFSRPDQVSAVSVPASEAIASPSSCCTSWKGFDITGTLVAASRDPDVDVVPCVDCVGGAPAPNIGIPFPEAIFGVGRLLSTIVTFHSTIAGPCTVGFGWYSPGAGQFIAGNSLQLTDCGSNTIWLINFFGNQVPPAPGGAVAVGIIQALDGTVDVDYMQFFIQ